MAMRILERFSFSFDRRGFTGVMGMGGTGDGFGGGTTGGTGDGFGGFII
jgi:hypothetical protein